MLQQKGSSNFENIYSIIESESFYPSESELLNWRLEDVSFQETLSTEFDQRSNASPSSTFLETQSNNYLACTSQTNTTSDDLLSVIMSPFSSIDDTFKTIDHWSKSSPVTSNSNEKHCYKKTEQSSNPNKLIADAFAIFGCSMSDDQSMEAAESSTFCHIDPAVKRISHNAIERRYRNNINERICELKNAVPALYMANIDKEQRASCSGDSSDNDDNSTNERHRSKEHMNEIVDGVEVARKLNKATILRKATEYIYHLKRTIAIAEQESQILQYILTQVPQGDSLLSSFHQRQFQIRQAEQEKKMHERRVAAQREKLIRERVLRERAVERASVAKLLPKRERKPYRRRTKQEIDEQRSVGKQDKTSLACHSSSSINHFSSPSVL